MQSWPSRVIEEANLFNPAFCTALLAKASEDFLKKAGKPLPFPLAFLILPIVLHRATREALPGSTVTSLLSWIEGSREHLVDFPTRVRRLKDISRESILFGTQCGSLTMTLEGELAPGPQNRTATERRTPLFTAEARNCVERAGFLGRWLAVAGTTATIYAAWGITP
jgi:hypothetical protein